MVSFANHKAVAGCESQQLPDHRPWVKRPWGPDTGPQRESEMNRSPWIPGSCSLAALPTEMALNVGLHQLCGTKSVVTVQIP